MIPKKQFQHLLIFLLKETHKLPLAVKSMYLCIMEQKIYKESKVVKLDGNMGVTSVAFSPDGTKVVSK
jgi:hypothetical protein